MPLVALGAVLWPGRAGALAAGFSASALLLYALLGWRLLLFTYDTGLSQALAVALVTYLPPAPPWESACCLPEPSSTTKQPAHSKR